jgi:outer membrane protein OmpA-like peptidoglycan-associated protein
MRPEQAGVRRREFFMRLHLGLCAAVLVLGGCSLFGHRPHYSVYFRPYSADLDAQANATLHTAADYALAHPTAAVFVTGYAAPPDQGKDVDGLSGQRADAVTKALTDAGVRQDRVVSTANGTTDPGDLPSVSVRRVDIKFGS